ncbi:hypothetical protein HDU79_002384 [Rhizoclosmatium sp. JEL0117]|nr:hypothetical protein HDU79_002384 [Rhizoclosmatium sp. JEL0117]
MGMKKKSLKKTLLASSAFQPKSKIAKKGGPVVAQSNAPKKLKNRNVRVPYSHDETMLLVGEGNFSFSNSLLSTIYVQAPENMTSTSYDSEEVVHEKYPDAKSHLTPLIESGVKVFHGVDARDLGKTKALKGKTFDVIVFNFPHVGLGIKDQDRNVMANQDLISGFFESALKFLKPSGEIHIAIKNSVPYTLWNIKTLGANHGLSLRTKTPFVPETMYPLYAHRRTIGFDERLSTDDNEDLKRGAGDLVNCFTFAFWRKEYAQKQAESKQKKKKPAPTPKKDAEYQIMWPGNSGICFLKPSRNRISPPPLHYPETTMSAFGTTYNPMQSYTCSNGMKRKASDTSIETDRLAPPHMRHLKLQPLVFTSVPQPLSFTVDAVSSCVGLREQRVPQQQLQQQEFDDFAGYDLAPSVGKMGVVKGVSNEDLGIDMLSFYERVHNK